MISKETINSIYPILDVLTAANTRVYPLDESPLRALNNAANTLVVESHTNETGFMEAWTKSLERSCVLGQTGINEMPTEDGSLVTINASLFSLSLDESASLIATSVKNAMSNARNTVLPIYNSVIDKMTEYLEDVTVVREPYELIDINLTPVWESPVVQLALDKFEPALVSMARSKIPRVPCPESLEEDLITGSVEFDRAFALAVKESGVSVSELFDAMFNGVGDLSGVLQPYYLTRNKSIVMFLMAYILQSRPVANTGVSSDRWESCLLEMTRTLGNGCSFIIQLNESDFNAKKLFYGIDQASNKVHLNGSVYDQWLTEGGTPELLFGAVMQYVNEGMVIGYQETLDKRTQLIAVWGEYHASQKVLGEAFRVDRIKKGLFTLIGDEINNADLIILPDEVNKKAMVGHLTKEIAAINAHSANNLGVVTLDIICDVMFYHTPAKYLLKRNNDHCENGLTPDEAATQTMIEYISTWICSGLAISKQG